MKKLYLFLFFIFSQLPQLFAQKTDTVRVNLAFDLHTKFDHYTTKDGLSNNSVSNIVQDSLGFMWFATADGLSRFDGYEFINYKHNKNVNTSISDNNISALTVDQGGDVWVGTKNGLNKYSHKTNSFTRFYYDNKSDNCIAHNSVRALHSDKEGFLYIETFDGTFHQYDIKKNIFLSFNRRSDINSNYPMHQIYEDRNGIIWAGGANTDVISFDKKSKKFIIHDILGCSFLEDIEGNFFIAYHESSMFIYDRENKKIKKYLSPPSVYCMYKDSKNNFWMGGYGFGLGQFNYENNLITIFKHNTNNPFSILSNRLLAIYEDKSGVLWLATGMGISKLSYNKYKFKHIYNYDSKNDNPTSNKIITIKQQNDSILWLGTLDAGLDKYNLKTGIFKNYSFDSKDKNTIASNHVTGIDFDKKSGDVWVSLWNGFSGALNKIDEKNNVVKRFDVFDKWLGDIKITKDNELWAACWGYAYGIINFDKEKEHITDKHFNKYYFQNWVSSINVVGGDLLINNNFIFNINNQHSKDFKTFFIYTKEDREDAKRKNNFFIERLLKEPNAYSYQVKTCGVNKNIIILKSLTDIEGEVWLVDKGGTLVKYDIKENLFEDYCVDNNINDAVFDKKSGNIIFSNKDNLVEFDIKNKKKKILIAKIGKANNLISDNNGNIYLSNDTTLFAFNLKSSELEKICQITNTKKIIIQSKNELILSTESEVFQVYIKEKKFVEIDIFEKNEKNALTLNNLYIDSKNELWLSTNKGLFSYNLKTKKKEIYVNEETKSNTLLSNRVFCVVEHNNDYWIATDKGLCRLDNQNKNFTHFDLTSDYGLSSFNATNIYEDKDGFLWVGTSFTGLNKVNLQTNFVNHYYSKTYDDKSLSHVFVNCVFQDSKDVIWVGTKKGLNKYISEKDYRYRRLSRPIK
jgi:ligand-binding sensor domain-containing protein